jgi:hypothetical protein
VAILWLDTHDAAQELRRHGVDHAQARERLAVLPASEQAEAIDPRGAAGRLLRELGVDYEDVVRRIEEEGARRVRSEDWRPEELPVEGWQEFRVTDAQDQAIRRRFHAVDRPLRRRGVRYMFGRNMDDPEWSLVRIHPGASGLDPREVLDRLLGPAS